jgi:predicted deacetylase
MVGRRSFADTSGVYIVILVALHERTHKLRRDQFDLMSERRQQARHVMGTGTSLHYNRASMKRREEFDHLPALQFLAKHRLTPSILAVNLRSRSLGNGEINQAGFLNCQARGISRTHRQFTMR